MEKNIVIKTLEAIIGTDTIGFISGKVEDIGTVNCSLSDGRGCVYGFAVRIDENLDELKEKLKEQCSVNNDTLDNWMPIKDNWYPLYWGRDLNMGLRLDSHVKEITGTGTIQLCKIDALKGHEVVYGALPCINYKENESKMHNRYPDILKTRKGKKKTTCPSKFLKEQLDENE